MCCARQNLIDLFIDRMVPLVIELAYLSPVETLKSKLLFGVQF